MIHTYQGGFKARDRVIFQGEEGTVAEGDHMNVHPMHVPVVFDGSFYIHHLHYDELTRPEPEVARIGWSGYGGQWQPTGEKFEVMFNATDPPGTFYLREREDG